MYAVIPDAGGTPVNSSKQCMHCYMLPPPFDLVPFMTSGIRMMTWSSSGPWGGGIYVKWPCNL